MDTKTINLRDVPEDLVRRAKAYAALRGLSLKDFIMEAMQQALDTAEPMGMALFAHPTGKTKERRKRRR
jgi:uncharacterized protein (DUF1778 family)